MFHSRASLLLLFVGVLSASGLAFQLDAQPLVRVEGVLGGVNGAQQKEGTTWFVTTEGLFYSVNGHLVGKREPADGKSRALHCLETVGGEIWIGADDGVFRIRYRDYSRVHTANLDNKSVDFILDEVDGQKTWIGTDQGLYYISQSPGSAESTNITDPVTLVKLVGSDLWVATATDIYIKRDDRFEPLYEATFSDVGSVLKATDGHLYLTAMGGLTRPRDLFRHPDFLRPLQHAVLATALVDGRLWYSMDRVLCIATDEGCLEVDVPTSDWMGRIGFIAETTRDQWLVSNDGIYRRERSEPEGLFIPFALKHGSFSFNGILETEAGTWFWGRSGVYYLRKDAGITIKLNTTHADPENAVPAESAASSLPNLAETALSKEIEFDVSYRGRPLGNRQPEYSPDPRFRILARQDKQDFEHDQLDLNKYDVPREVTITAPEGHSDLFIAVIDRHGYVHTEKRSIVYSPEKTNWKKIFEVRIGTLVIGALLIYIFTPFLFLMLTVVFWPLPEWRLRFYFSAIRIAHYLPGLRPHLGASVGYMRAYLRSIIVQQKFGNSVGFRSFKTRTFVEHLIRNQRIEVPLSVRHFDLCELLGEVVRRRSMPLRIMLPVTIVCRTSRADIDEGSICEKVVRELRSTINHSSEAFCRELLLRGRFVFVFMVSPNNALRRAVEEFLSSRGRGRDYVIIVNQPG